MPRDTSVGLFSLNTVLLAERIPLQWANSRRAKLFDDLGMRSLYRKKAALGSSVPYLLSDLFGYIKSHRRKLHDDVIRQIIREEWYLAGQQWGRVNDARAEQYFREHHQTLLESLRHDGLRIKSGELVPPTDEELQKDSSSLKERLHKAKFELAFRHFDQAFENYVFSRWEAANSQLRTFVEALLDEIYHRLYPKEMDRGSSGARRKYLEDRGFFGNAHELVYAFFRYASTAGSHAGWSSEEDCRFRANLAIKIAEYCLTTYDLQSRRK